MTADQPSGEPANEDRRRPSLLAGAGHLGALWALAIAQPLLDLLGRNPDFFIARGNTSADIVVVALLVSIVPPLLMLAAEAVAERFDPGARWVLHLGLLGLLSAALALQVLKLLVSRPAGPMLVLALGAGVAGAWAYSRGSVLLRSLLDFLTPAPVVVLAIFLLFSDSSRLVLPQEEEAEAAALEFPARPPIIFMIFDELPLGTLLTPAGTIDRSRFPNFAQLARRSTWYRGATAAADSTPRAIPALLTGRVPGPDELPVAFDQPRSLFTLLGSSYEMRVSEEATRLCPAELCAPVGGEETAGERLGSLFADLQVVTAHLVLPDGVREGLPDIDKTFGDFAAEVDSDAVDFAVNDQLQLITALREGSAADELFARFLDGIDGRDGTLDFLHFEVPHYPWVRFADGLQYTSLANEFKPFFNDAGKFIAPRAVTDTALQRHLLEAGYADTLLGQVIDRLDRLGAWRRAMVVVVSDHGAAFIPDGYRRTVTRRNIGQLAPVPLFVKAPGQVRGRDVRRHFCLTGLLPLLGRELGIRYPWERTPCDPETVVQSRVTTPELEAGDVDAPVAGVESGLRHFVLRIDRLFGSGRGWEEVFALGPAKSLVGRRVDRVEVAPSEAEAEINGAGRFADGPVGATLLRGEAPGVSPGLPLAVAVNGRFVASDQAFDVDGETFFSVLFPPDSLRPGPNRVELYAVPVTGRRPAVALLGSA